MKHTLLLIFLFIMTMVAWAQSPITIDPNPKSQDFAVDFTGDFLDLELHTTIKNTTNQKVSLKWTRVVKNSPVEWETAVCDNNVCYTPGISSNVDASIPLNMPFELEAGESFDLIFHVYPYTTAGTGSFELIFALTSAPDTPIDTARFSTNVVANTTTSTFDIAKADVRVFPNPTTNYFELTDTRGFDRLVVYNVLGRTVRSFQAMSGQRYSLEGLPDGLYLVTMQSRNKIVKTVRLSKRSWRP